jgi:hypothetical protein
MISAYALLSFVAATWFAFGGVDRINPKARGAGIGFRLLLIPASLVLWPWLCWRART